MAHRGVLAIVVVGGAGLLTNVIKVLTDRARPLHVSEWVNVSGGSFPSGHASGAVAFYGVLGYLLACQVPDRWRFCVPLGCGTVALTVASTRVILRAHWLSDVVAGVVLGLAWLLLCIAVAQACSRPAAVEP
jgi:undecaprenyl-diphosphatase